MEEDDDLSIQKVRFTTTVTHSAGSMAEAYDVLIEDGVTLLYVEYFSPPMRPPFGTSGLTVDESQISFKLNQLAGQYSLLK